MYLIYVDESGDVGRQPGSSPGFALSGMVIHELCWHQTVQSVVQFRRALRLQYGLRLREEIHAGEMMRHPGRLARIPKSLRLRILRDALDFQAGLTEVSIINIWVEKAGKSADFDVFDAAWSRLIQRFENTLSHHNFPGPQNARDHGVLIVDQTDEPKLRALTRRMRAYNPVSNYGGIGFRHLPISTLVEDPSHRDSAHSFLIQLMDVNAYFLYQKHAPCSYLRRKGGVGYFDRLEPILCKVASSSDPQGIVRV